MAAMRNTLKCFSRPNRFHLKNGFLILKQQLAMSATHQLVIAVRKNISYVKQAEPISLNSKLLIGRCYYNNKGNLSS